MSNAETVKIDDIILDYSIYPRNGIDHKRVSMFEENMRNGFEFDLIHLQEHPDEPGKYRILDGSHRFQAYKGIGEKEVYAEIIHLNGKAPLLYAAQKAIGPRQLNDDEARKTARRAYQENLKLSSEEIGTPALEEDEESAILIIDYGILMRKAGWAVSHIMQAPMSSERFQSGTVSAMQHKKILGVTARNVPVGRKK